MNIQNYVIPQTIEEAYKLVQTGGRIISGGAFVCTSNAKVDTVVDLRDLGLNFINEYEDRIEIGPATTLREVETSKILNGNFNGYFENAIGRILGIQLRNLATIGGSICGRYGFSDVICSLSALNVTLEFHNYGEISLDDFIARPSVKRDILKKIIIEKNNIKASYEALRHSNGDFPMITCSVSNLNGKYKVIVGCRPLIAAQAEDCMAILNSGKELTEKVIDEAMLALDNLAYGNNYTATKEYRQQVAKVIVKRCLMEVM
ncbi:FAD binding domain-containing protein [Clostridium cylindrosporum]|uniref:Aerobic-type carbon monoxide dehydrogenase, middle subunit CoxM/CutM n=1 Tax=Clostridium cylindrosporum DSM 605 TaxID=1121307 RepID=A0A0J8D8F9_CLOCY|nr:FAD binding domain-containing protein [Clostridium cylindrosporum]KMT22162.1 aerobic-type carbon monoxide dehydrogenase, middle subunit CoxM/CutM [Clostridium cylindrosporum DSM 605]